MGGVRYQTLGGGLGVATRFADNFTRANSTAPFIGSQYVFVSQSPALQGTSIDTPCGNIAANQLRFARVGAAGGGQYPGGLYFPLALLNSRVNGRRQFSQATFISRAGAVNTDGGVFVLANPYWNSNLNFQAYSLRHQQSSGTLRLEREGSAIPGATLATIVYAPVGNDVWRLEVVPEATQNTLTAFVNGAQVMTATDNTVNRIQGFGFPAIGAVTVVTVGVITFDDFSCGLF